MEAILYEVGSDFREREVCRLTVVGGTVVASNSHPLGRFVLSRPLVDFTDDEGKMLTKEDGEAFLKLLPASYSGSRFRVSLKW